MGLFHDIGHQVGLILQENDISLLPLFPQDPMDILLCQALVASPENDNAIVSLGIYLDDGMTALARQGQYGGDICPGLFQHFRKRASVLSHRSGMNHRGTCSCRRHRLVQALSAHCLVKALGMDRLPRAHKVLHLINLIHIHGTK